MRKTFIPIILVLAVLAFPAAAALTGSASGVVKDTTGQPLPGVSVSIAGPSLQGTRTTVTRHDGTFSFFTLPPGKSYKVTFNMPGFVTVVSEPFAVAMDLDTQVPATMKMESLKTEIVVSAEAPLVDVTQTQQQQNFTADYLKKIPIGSGNRSYQNIPLQSAGVVASESGGNPSVYGGNSMENSYLVDGVNTTDPVTHTFSFNLNYDAVQEVALQKSGYDAEYGHASGGVLNVVTKSGGNEFTGTFDIRYNNNKMTRQGDWWDQTTEPGVTPVVSTHLQKYNHDLSESRNTPWGVTLGGPVVKDRLWFFLNSARADSYSIPFTSTLAVIQQNPSPAVSRFTGWNSGGKLSFTIMPELSGFFALEDSQANIPNYAGATYRPEAQPTQDQKSRLYSLKLNGVLNSSWITELNLGRSESYLKSAPSSGDDSISSWTNVNAATGGSVVYDSYSNDQQSHRDRNLAGLQTTYFIQNFLGNHQVKVGADTDLTNFPNTNFTTGTPSDPSFCAGTDGRTCGATFQFNGFDANGNRKPYKQFVTENLPLQNNRSRSFDAYIQDQWRPIQRLTLSLGVRWDEFKYHDNNGINFLNFVKVQPRVAIALDVFGDGKTAIRANYGQFYVDAALTLASRFNSNFTTAVSRTYQWSNAQQKWIKTGTTGGTFVTAGLIDGSLKPTYDEQVSLAADREIVSGLKIAGSYVYKKTKDIFDDTCTTYYDASGKTVCPDYWTTNYPGRSLGIENPLKKNYFGYTLELQYNKGRVLASGSYTYSKSRGSINSSDNQFANSDFDVYPDDFVNKYGYMDDDARNRIKLFGNYRIPFIETDLGFGYSYRSGLAYTVLATGPVSGPIGYTYDMFTEPRGTSRTAVLHNLDIEAKKSVPLTDRVSATVIVSCLNVFNSQQPVTYQDHDDSNYTRVPTSFQRPRGFQVGFRVDWQ